MLQTAKLTNYSSVMSSIFAILDCIWLVLAPFVFWCVWNFQDQNRQSSSWYILRIKKQQWDLSNKRQVFYGPNFWRKELQTSPNIDITYNILNISKYHSSLRILTPPMETLDPPFMTPRPRGRKKQVATWHLMTSRGALGLYHCFLSFIF